VFFDEVGRQIGVQVHPMAPDPLLSVGGNLAGIVDVSTLEAARLVLAPLNDETLRPSRSTLNNDGSPLQVCISCSRVSRGVRLLGDPSGAISERDYADPCNRFQHARRALCDLLAATNCGLLAPFCKRILDGMLPTDWSEAAKMSGPLWLGVGLNRPGVAVYVNARHGTPGEQWTRIEECLQTAANVEKENQLLSAIRPHSFPAGLGIEGTCPSDARAKVYWRLREPVALRELRCPLFLNPTLAEFLSVAVGQSIPLSGLVFGAGFGIAGKRLRDVKIDVCAHCVRRPVDEWLNIIECITRKAGLAPMDVEPALRSGAVAVAILGLGVDESGDVRLNLYLKGSSV
jgi:hypothetical protein